MEDCFNVFWLDEGYSDYPTIFGEDHYDLDAALQSAFHCARTFLELLSL